MTSGLSILLAIGSTVITAHKAATASHAAATNSYTLTVIEDSLDNLMTSNPENAFLNTIEKKIYNTDVFMEYSLNDRSTWSACTGGVVSVPSLSVGNRVWVRNRNNAATEFYLGQVLATSARSDLIARKFTIGTGTYSDTNTATPGDLMSLLFYFKNIGDTTAAASIHVRLFASTDRTITAGDTLVHEFDKSINAASGVEASVYLSSAFTMPSIVPGHYYIGAILDTANSLTELNDDNQITSPSNVDELWIKDATALPAGAFKIVNSWGKGGSWENIADGYYWVTYQTMKSQQMPIYYFYNNSNAAYRPTVIAVFNINHSNRSQAWVTVGLGDPANPFMQKDLQSRWGTTLQSGALPFPSNSMVVDISEFAHYLNDYNVFIKVNNQGTTTGTIQNFSVECYSSYEEAAFRTINSATAMPVTIAASTSSSAIINTQGAFNTTELGLIIPPPRFDMSGNSFVERSPTAEELISDKERIGVYKPGVNYNRKVNGMGTGFQPPDQEAWKTLKKLQAFSSVNVSGPLPTSFDNSTSSYFPPIGNQGGEGSCTAFSIGYYIHTYNEAREHNWDLSTTTWGGTWPGQPQSNLNKIMSPDFIYHQINSGTDSGSNWSMAGSLAIRLGVATWNTMPYNTANSTSWPSEAAWREAPRYRASAPGNNYWDYSQDGYFIIKTDADIYLLKSLIAAGYCVSTGVQAASGGMYDLFSGEDVADNGTTGPMSIDHAQTIVGYKEGTAWNINNP